MKSAGLTALIVSALMLASPAAADVRLTIGNGQVSVSASNATIREILAEWAKVGQTKIVNAERVPGGPMTLELTNLSEVEALEIILRSVSGYLLALRPVPTPNTSKYDRILIVPTSNSARPASPAPAFARPAPVPAAARPPEPEETIEGTPDEPSPPNVAPAPAARPPVFNTFPQPQPQQATPPPPPPAPTTAPSSPAGVPTPGMMTPAPQQQPGLPSPGNPN